MNQAVKPPSLPLDQSIIDLYDDYTHRPLARRIFMERLVKLTGSTIAATSALAVLEPDYALAAIVPENDSRITVSRFDDATAGLKGYVAAPGGTKPEAANNLVIVIHENRGLNPHIEDVARRLATDGFVAMAPDMLTPMGGTPADPDAARDMFPRLDLTRAVASLAKLIDDRKKANPNVKIGVVGFCWGGGMVNALATAAPQLAAAVAYYGVAPKLENVPHIKARMMMHYAGLDTRVNATRPGYEAALKKAGVPYQMFVYEGANHAFNNDTSKERYNEAAAKLAWQRTIAFLKETLK